MEAARTGAIESLKAKRDQADAAGEARRKQMSDHVLKNRAKDTEGYAVAAMAVLELAQ